MDTFTYVPAVNQQKKVTPRVLVAKFGDGYEQRIPDGINNKVREYSLTFNRSVEELDEIEAFLDDKAGVEAFDWTPLNGTRGTWKCEDWTRNDILLSVGSITAIFKEVFE